jgi:hypothetical protein
MASRRGVRDLVPGERVIWWRGRARYRQDAEVVRHSKKRVVVLYRMRVHYVSGTVEEDALAWVRPENLEVPSDG